MAAEDKDQPSPSEGRALTRAQTAWGMKQAGLSLSEIAEELGLEDVSSVPRLLAEQYKADAAFLTSEDRLGLLALEWERLESLIKANWASAMMGDPKSADVVLKTIAMQVKLAQLDAPDSSTDQAKVLVIGGAEADYVKALQQAAE